MLVVRLKILIEHKPTGGVVMVVLIELEHDSDFNSLPGEGKGKFSGGPTGKDSEV